MRSCSFCEKSQREVEKLIVGNNVCICDECVSLYNDIIAESRARKVRPSAIWQKLIDPAS